MRHYKIYYPVRMDMVQHMINSMQRLGFTPSATIEHRKLAVDLAEVIVEWEKQRYKDEEGADTGHTNSGVKRQSTDSNESVAAKRQRGSTNQVCNMCRG